VLAIVYSPEVCAEFE
jgi:hypothetical protein